ncbi:MAG: Hsp20/alpha crystallin family protein [Clostridia bacterium]
MLKFGSLFDDFDDLSIYKKGNKTILVYEVVGINKEDLKVQLMSKNGENKIIITGETENDITESKYMIDTEVVLDEKAIRNVSSRVENGLLYVTVEYAELEMLDNVKSIEIE